MKKIGYLVLIILLTATFTTTWAQNNSGKLGSKTIKYIQDSFKETPENSALINAITHNDIKKLSKNRFNEGKLNHLINTKVSTHGISNQKSSGSHKLTVFSGISLKKPICF